MFNGSRLKAAVRTLRGERKLRHASMQDFRNADDNGYAGLRALYGPGAFSQTHSRLGGCIASPP